MWSRYTDHDHHTTVTKHRFSAMIFSDGFSTVRYPHSGAAVQAPTVRYAPTATCCTWTKNRTRHACWSAL
eukprot:5260270-Prymnesium_polylepis.1